MVEIENWRSHTLRSLVSALKLVSKPLSKIGPRANFWFQQFSKVCLALPKNGFSFFTEKIYKKGKTPCHFHLCHFLSMSYTRKFNLVFEEFFFTFFTTFFSEFWKLMTLVIPFTPPWLIMQSSLSETKFSIPPNLFLEVGWENF